MDDDPVVRPIEPQDLGAVVGILMAGSRTPWAEDPAELSRYEAAVVRIRAGGGDVLVAVRDGAVVGMCQVSLLAHFQHAGGTVAELESVHVAVDHRGSGVGSALLDDAIRWARERGCYRVQLTSHRDREDAHRFYERAGFEPTHVGFKLALRVDGPDAGATPA